MGEDQLRPVVEAYSLQGVEAVPIEVQVALSDGYPQTTIVGLPDTAVRESRERIHAAFRQMPRKLFPEFHLKARKVLINLAPAEMRKEGSGFDLPIALGILAAHGHVPGERLRNLAAVGEISLDGRIRRVRGALACALAASRAGGRRLLLPAANLPEIGTIPEVEPIPVTDLEALVGWIRDDSVPTLPAGGGRRPRAAGGPIVDLSTIAGQRIPKRALEIAAAGGHNLLFVGPPGTGKTLLARALPGILPPLTELESLETTVVQSVAGVLPEGEDRVRVRPFRAPHHTVSPAGLVGGGLVPRPGEISLAHRGVLFLDELPEFRTGVLELLRQPLEEGEVRLVRAGRAVRFPCRFTLVAAMNPCPCGFLGSHKPCRCTPAQVQRYRSRIGGPLLDRIDLHVEVGALRPGELPTAQLRFGEGSAEVATRVAAARGRQEIRYRDLPDVLANADLGHEAVPRFCPAEPAARALLERAAEVHGFSARAVHRCLRVARTIADLVGAERLDPGHVAEAVQYRMLDRTTESV